MDLNGLIQWVSGSGLVYAIGFVAFFTVSAVAVYSSTERAKRAWTALFFTFLVVPVLIGSNWPFLAWGLYDDPAPTETTQYQMFLEDEDGDLVRYDARALGPVTSTVLRGYSERMVTKWSDAKVAHVSREFLSAANEHLREAESGYGFRADLWVPNGLRFPRHQLDYRWNESVVEASDQFVAVVIYRIDATIRQDGSDVQSVDCTAVELVSARGEIVRSPQGLPEPPYEPCER